MEKTTKKFLYGLGILCIFLMAAIFVIGVGNEINNSGQHDEINKVGSTHNSMAIQANNSVNNKGLIFKFGDDKVYTSRGFKGNISANEVIIYELNTTGWEDVIVRFYSDDGIDVNIIEGNVENINSIVEKKFESIKKTDCKIKGGLDNVNISIKGKKDGRYGVVVMGVKKKDGGEKPKPLEIKLKK